MGSAAASQASEVFLGRSITGQSVVDRVCTKGDQEQKNVQG